MKSYWHKINKQFVPSHKLQSSYDVVIVGAGLSGLTLAYYLKQQGVNCVVLERDKVGGGASGRNEGQVLIDTAETFSRMSTTLGYEKACDIIDFRVKNLEVMKKLARASKSRCSISSLVRAGSVNEMDELKQSYDLYRDNDIDVELDKNGLWFPQCISIDPYKLCCWLASQVDVVEGVDCGLCDGGILKTNKGDIEHSAIVCTTGYELNKLVGDKVWAIRAQMASFSNVDCDLESSVSENYGHEYYKYWNNTFMMGGFRTQDEKSEETDELALNHHIQNYIHHHATDYIGYITKEEDTTKWAGIMGFSKDGLALIGHLRSNTWVMGGYSGYGLSSIGYGAKVLAEVIAGNSHGVALKHFDPKRF